MAGTKDWVPRQFPELTWNAGKQAESLALLCEYCIGTSKDARDWYERWRGPKKSAASALRLLAIVAAAVAGVIPLLGQIIPKTIGDQQVIPGINPLWSGVALAFAALLVLLDQFWGFTTGWVRYLLASQELAQELDMFCIDIEKEKISWDAGAPKPEEALATIEKCKDFLEGIHTIVRDETNEWAKDFKAVVAKLDKAAKPLRKTTP